MGAIGGVEFSNRDLHVLVDGYFLVMSRISPISRADLPLATHRRTSLSRAVSLGFAIGRRRIGDVPIAMVAASLASRSTGL